MAAVFPVLKRGFKVLHVLFLSYLWLLLALYLGFKFFERAHLIQALPAALEVSGVQWIAGESDLREGCGVAVFTLTAQTRQRLQSQGMAALVEARQARGYDDYYYHYEAWQVTPAPSEFTREGWLALSCGAPPKALGETITGGLNNPGGYFSTKREGMLLVLPAEGLVVLGYDG